jgi:hypothetical protein
MGAMEAATILLVSQIDRVLPDVALLALPVRILCTLLTVRGLNGQRLFALASSLPAQIVRRDRRHPAGHDSASWNAVEACSARGTELVPNFIAARLQ